MDTSVRDPISAATAAPGKLLRSPTPQGKSRSLVTQDYEAHACGTQICKASSMHDTVSAKNDSRWRGMECSGIPVLPGAEWSVESGGFRMSEVTCH